MLARPLALWRSWQLEHIGSTTAGRVGSGEPRLSPPGISARSQFRYNERENPSRWFLRLNAFAVPQFKHEPLSSHHHGVR